MSNVAWIDLTVEDAERVRDFYAGVMGWGIEAVDMGGYSDFNMLDAETGEPTAGVCYARAGNKGIPPVWMVYFVVDDLDASLTECNAKGGEVLKGPQKAGGSRYAIIRDPAGAACALVETGGEEDAGDHEGEADSSDDANGSGA
jgi:predicted enzyme related to lactoylglutathione lyase